MNEEENTVDIYCRMRKKLRDENPLPKNYRVMKEKRNNILKKIIDKIRFRKYTRKAIKRTLRKRFPTRGQIPMMRGFGKTRMNTELWFQKEEGYPSHCLGCEYMKGLKENPECLMKAFKYRDFDTYCVKKQDENEHCVMCEFEKKEKRTNESVSKRSDQ